MKSIVSIVLLAVLASNVGQGKGNSQVRVEVYYEHLCPDSIRWVTNQLLPTYEVLGDLIDIDFIPFGKARSINNGAGGFECQHGPAECEGNMIQSCVLHQLEGNQDAQVSYVGCQMNFSADPRGYECAFRAGVNLNQAEACTQGQQGIQLQLEAERRTQLISPAFVPTIVFNGIFNQHLQDRAQTEFAEILCELSGHTGVGC